MTVTANVGTTTGSDQYDSDETVTISTTAPAAGIGEQYVWAGWVGTGTGSYNGMDNPASVVMNDDITETATWTHQYQLTMDANLGTTDPSLGDSWNDDDSTITITATAPAGGSYDFDGWTGTGTGSYTGTANPSAVTMNGPIIEKAIWAAQVIQYQLIVTANVGTTIGADQYDSAETVTISTTAPAAGIGEQYVWAGWVGTGTGSYKGMDNPASVVMNDDITETATWTHQYQLTMDASIGTTTPNIGTKWVDAGSTVEISASATAPFGETYVFYEWIGSGIDGLTGTSNKASLTMNEPIEETAYWHVIANHYQLTVKSASGSTTGAGLYDPGSIVSVMAIAPSVGVGERYIWNGWTGTGSISYTGTSNYISVTMNSDITETASFLHQYELTVATNTGTTAPAVGISWINSGSSQTITAIAPTGATYVLQRLGRDRRGKLYRNQEPGYSDTECTDRRDSILDSNIWSGQRRFHVFVD